MTKLRDPFLIIILLANFLLGTSILTRGHEWGDDFASYIMQAQSILNGNTDEFIQRNSFTIFESSFQIGPVAYPWGYPLILTPVLLLKGVHALALKLPGLFFFTGFLACLHLLLETRLTRTESLLIVSLFAFNPTLISFLDFIITDIPFLFVALLALLLITKLDSKQSTWMYPALGAIIFFAFFIRTTGIILLAGFLAYQALRFYQDTGKRRSIVTNSIIVTVVFVALWLAVSLIFPSGQSAYFRQLAGFNSETLPKNIRGYFYLFVQFLDPNSSPLWTLVYYMLVVFFLVGAWTRHKADQILLIFFALYLAIMLIWPEWQGVRFIFPLLPIFIYIAFQGTKTVVGILQKKYQPVSKGTVYLFWMVIAGIFLFSTGVQAYTNLKDNRQINGPFDPYSDEVFNFIREETPPDSVVIFFKPRAMRLFTDRDSIMTLECSYLPKGDYLALHKNWEYSQILPGNIHECNQPMDLVFENRRFLVYKILK